MSRLTSGKWLLGLAAWLLVAGTAMPQSDPSIDEVRRREQVAAQALEQDIQAALAAADKLKAEPAKAKESLEAALGRLDKDTTMDLVRKAKLINTVKDRIKSADTAIEREKKAGSGRPAPSAGDSQDAGIQRELETIRALERAGKTDEARRLADRLAGENPNNRAAETASDVLRRADTVHESREIQQAKASARVRFQQDLDKGTTAPSGDITYSKKFPELSEKRLAAAKARVNPLTEREKEILRTLDEVTTGPVAIKDVPLDEVIKMLQKELGLPVLVNKASLEDVKVGYDNTISLSLPRGVSKRSLLKAVLGELGLAYVIKNEAIEITSAAKAQSEMVTRTIQIDDLVRSNLRMGGGGTVGAGTPIDVPALIQLIVETVEPNSWKKNGGLGDIIYFAPTRSLIIKNSAEVINRMGLSSKQP